MSAIEDTEKTVDAAPKGLSALNALDYRRIATCLVGGLVLAVMTGPQSSIETPLAGFKDSLLTGHVVGGLVVGVVVAVLSTYRAKVRDGVWRAERRRERVSLLMRVAHLDPTPRTVVKVMSGVVTLFAALTVAVFTGPYAAHKFSGHVYVHQFAFTRTYAYLAIATILWALVWRELEGSASVVGRIFLGGRVRAVVSFLVLGVFFALAADPFLQPAFRWKYLSPTGSSSLFHHWPTYVWLVLAVGGALVVSRRLGAPARPGSPAQSSRVVRMSPSFRTVLYVGAFFAAVEVPKFLAPYWQLTMYQQVGIFCLLAVGLNVVVGFAGLLDLGYVAFYALGAYVAAYFTGALPAQPPIHLNPFLVIPIAILAAMLAGVLLGLPTLRLRGDYLAIVTLGFGEIVVLLANNLPSITGASQGTYTIPTFKINFLGIDYAWITTNALSYYYLMLAVLVIVVVLFNSLNHSKVGRSWAAIREDEVAAESLGVNALKYKVMAFAIGASTAGVAGVFTAAKIGILFPQVFVLQLSITVLVLVIFGGMGSIMGVLVGAAFLQWLPVYLTFHSFFGYQQQDLYLYVGALLVIMMIFRPQGLIPSRRRVREFVDAEAGQGTADATGTDPEGPLA